MKFVFLFAVLLPLGAAAAPSGDACQFIRDQLASAQAGDVVTVPAGTYVCQTPVILDHDGVTLQGEKAGSVTLRLANHANCPLVVIGHAETPPSPVHDITVNNLILDGNMSQQDMECWGGPCDQGGTAFVRNNGVTVRGAFDCAVENVTTFSNRSGGLVTERGTRHLIVRNFESHDNYFDGLAGYETEDSEFSQLYLHHNHFAGISIDLIFNHNRFDNVLIQSNGDVGIFARWSIGNSFERMVIEKNGNHGIFLAEAGDVSRCPLTYSFRNAEVIGNKGWGLWFNNAECTGTTLVDSKFHDNRDGCFSSRSGAVSMSNVVCK